MLSSIGAACFIVAATIGPAAGAAWIGLKCCEDGFVLSDDLGECVRPAEGIGYRSIELERNRSESDNATNSCRDVNVTSPAETFAPNASASPVICVDYQKNGSLAYHDCWSIRRRPAEAKCDSLFTPINLYGATMMTFANVIYLISYSVVFLMYLLVPKICRRAYDKAVLSFAISQGILSITVIIVGQSMLCHDPLSDTGNSFIGLSLMTWTINGVLWLLVISLDVTSTITQFRWTPSSGTKNRDEGHKYVQYLKWVVGGTLIPVTTSGILEFSPLPSDNIAKPNFSKISSINYGVIVHVITVPILVAIASSVLFVYTTVKMINIQKSTSMANENRKKSVKEKYILYVKLYLLMDAPYVTGALGSIFEDLWILKFCRLMQPIIMLYTVFPRNVISDSLCCKKKSKDGINQTAKPKIVKETNEHC